MSTSEKIPLIPFSNASHRKTDAYLLLSVPPSEGKAFTNNLSNCGNYTSVIVGVTAVIIVLVLIVVMTVHADMSELTNGPGQIINTAILTATAGTGESKIITTPLGQIKGYTRTSREGIRFLSFYKVPYAEPPIEDLRFKNPQPVEAWKNVRDYTEANNSPQCIQKSKHTAEGVLGEEDCLYSNIYVPSPADLNDEISNFNYPTMVYIHGGGFDRGNASKYGAEYFMDEDVVLITFHYRLGLLGLLNTGDREATGNMGFKDQVMLLKWVQSNIQYYGGDPSKVTIFGNSVGSTCISFLMISPMGKGLFHRAISQSGTALCETTTFNIDLQPEVIKNAAAENFNCSLETSSTLLECLRGKPASDLALFEAPDTTKYALTVEKGFEQKDLANVFMSEQPYKLLQAGKVNQVPYMIGIMSTQMIGAALGLLKNENMVTAINVNFSQFIPSFLKFEVTLEESEIFKQFYFGDNPVGNNTERNLTNLISDGIFVHCSKVAAEMFSSQTETYLFYMSKHPKKSYAEKFLKDFPLIDKTEIVSHADEIQFILPYNELPKYPTTDKEYYPFSRFMVKLWAHFAATGNPVMNTEMDSWKVVSTAKTQLFGLN